MAAHLTGRGLATAVVDWRRLSFEGSPARMLLDGESFDPPRVAVVRSRVLTRHTEGDVALLYDWLEMLESLGVRLINRAQSIRTSQNKVYSLSLLARAALPIPPTRAVRAIEEVDRCVSDWQDVVLKPVYGHGSVDMLRLRAKPSDESAVREEVLTWHLLRRHHVLCAQRFIPNPGRDLRVVVIRGQVVSCTYRIAHSPNGPVKDHLNPYLQEPAVCTPEIDGFAARSCELLGLDCAAIDMVEGPGGVVILEVNPTVSLWRSLGQEGHHRTADGVAAAFAEMVVDTVEGRPAGGPS